MLRNSLAASSIMSSTTARTGNGIGAGSASNTNAASTKVRLAVPTGADFTSPRRSPQYLSRLTDVSQMDIQSALDQMRSLLSGRPQVVYKTAYYRKQTKNHWARDDPAFGALQAAFLTISSVAYSIAFRTTLMSGLAFLLYSLLWNWLVPGVILATIGRELANRHMIATQSSSHVKQSVEWLYAFDIHCNAFFPLFCLLCECFGFFVVHFIPLFWRRSILQAVALLLVTSHVASLQNSQNIACSQKHNRRCPILPASPCSRSNSLCLAA